jgi:hypothetical protein
MDSLEGEGMYIGMSVFLLVGVCLRSNKQYHHIELYRFSISEQSQNTVKARQSYPQ